MRCSRIAGLFSAAEIARLKNTASLQKQTRSLYAVSQLPYETA